jgi:exodeoxyribonuclease-5
MGDRVLIAPPGSVDVPDRVEAMPQVICGTHRRRWALTAMVRESLGFTGKFPQPGEHLICCKNSQYLSELINGVGGLATAPVAIAHDDPYAAVLYGVNEDDQPLSSDLHGAPAPIRCYRGLFDEHDLRERGAVHGDRHIAKYKWRELEHFDWGWAITCHKSQGSAWDDVLVWDESHVFRDDWKRWLYTAITRAASRLTIITR